MSQTEVIKVQEPQFNILTDLPLSAEWHSRANHDCGRMAALRQLFDMIDAVPVSSGIAGDGSVTRTQAELLYYLITQIKPILTIETGFNVGLLAGVMTAAHMMNGLHGGHIPIQDSIRSVSEDTGAAMMQRLALTGYQIMDHEPALVLPQIYLQRLNGGLKLVYFNSADSVEEQMMEYFYINRLMNPGGIMAINTGSEARRDLVAFIRRTRFDYIVRELDCSITLIQMPYAHEDMMRSMSGFKH